MTGNNLFEMMKSADKSKSIANTKQLIYLIMETLIENSIDYFLDSSSAISTW